MDKKNAIIVFLVLIVLGLAGYLVYDKFYNNIGPENNSSESKNEENNTSNNNQEKKLIKAEKDLFVYNDTSIFKTKISEFLNNNTKEVLVDDVNDYCMKMQVFNNKLYYFDKNKKFTSYDLLTKEKKKYNIELKDSVLIEFVVGDNYIIFYDGDKTLKYDIAKDSYEKMNVDINNYEFYYDYKNSNLYYVKKNNNLVIYNLETKNEEVFYNHARIDNITDNYLILDINDLYYAYNLNTKQKVLLNDYANVSLFDNASYEYDNTLYYLTTDNKINVVEDGVAKSIYGLGNQTLVNTRQIDKYILIDKNYEDPNGYSDILNIDPSKEEYILYNLETKEETKIDNSKGAILYNNEGFNVVY